MINYYNNHRGQTIVIFALMMVIIFGFAGLAIDVWQIVYNRQQLQNCVDLSALSGAQEMFEIYGDITGVIEEYLLKNGIDSSKGDGFTINYPYNGDDNKVEVIATRPVRLFFLPVLGFDNTNVSARAVAGVTWYSKTSIDYRALDYAIFHASNNPLTPLSIKANGSVIRGNVHSNSSIDTGGNKHTINGNVTAGGTIDLADSTVTGTVTAGVSEIPIPAINFDEYAAKADVVFDGDQTFNKMEMSGIWLVNGNCLLNGSKIYGRGILLVTGDVKITGSALQYNSADDLLAIYTKAQLDISATNTIIDGVLYAPYGRINMSGSGNTFNGALIANEVVWSTNTVVVNANYDVRVPQAFTENIKSYTLFE